MRKASGYLHRLRRRSTLWRFLLPQRIFRPEFRRLDSRAVSLGIAWGCFWAIAPVPMQSIFAVFSALATRANIPLAVVCCWISVPGYQLIVWPVQWYLGNRLLSWTGYDSGFGYEQAKICAQDLVDGDYTTLLHTVGDRFFALTAEFALGCLLSCGGVFLLVWGGVQLIFSFRKWQSSRRVSNPAGRDKS